MSKLPWAIGGGAFALVGYAWMKRERRAPSSSSTSSTSGAASSGAAPSSSPPSAPSAATLYRLQTWEPIVRALIASEFPTVPPVYAMGWAAMESKGNPCAVGDPNAKGPDGQPRELGIGQAYNPDDFANLPLAPAALRAYCDGGTQTVTRTLTGDELTAQVRYTLLLPIWRGIAAADRALKEHGLAWRGVDYWTLVKAPHALPAIINQGLPAVVRMLKRAPVSWAEFRTTLGMDQRGADGKPKYPQWTRALDACERCGRAMTPRAPDGAPLVAQANAYRLAATRNKRSKPGRFDVRAHTRRFPDLKGKARS